MEERNISDQEKFMRMVLRKYNDFLLKNGYVDDDIWCEGEAVNNFIESLLLDIRLNEFLD